jgi:hypothetical protein
MRDPEIRFRRDPAKQPFKQRRSCLVYGAGYRIKSAIFTFTERLNCNMLPVTLVIFLNLLSDTSYCYLDPCIKPGKAGC